MASNPNLTRVKVVLQSYLQKDWANWQISYDATLRPVSMKIYNMCCKYTSNLSYITPFKAECCILMIIDFIMYYK